MTSWRVRKRRYQRNAALAVLVIVVGMIYIAWPNRGDNQEAEQRDPGLHMLAGGMKDKPPVRQLPPTAEGHALSATQGADDSTASTQQVEDTPIAPANEPVTISDEPPASQPAETSPMRPVAVETECEALINAKEAIEKGDLLEARSILNQAMVEGLRRNDLEAARKQLAELADMTIFSDRLIPNDPLVEQHSIRSGDNLSLLAKRFRITPELIAEINNLRDANTIRAGQKLKLVQGPFHATVSKSDHLLHLYAQDVYVRSYPVALGKDGSTPIGKWKVRDKVTNPSWVDPRTHKRWHPNDPDNPIGEFWIGLSGIAGDAVGQQSYGIHGTIEPATIGQDVSLGCIRLATGNIDIVYKLLVPEHSVVTVIE